MEVFGVLFEEDIRRVLFADQNGEVNYDVNSIFDESTIDEIMKNEVHSPDSRFNNSEEFSNRQEPMISSGHGHVPYYNIYDNYTNTNPVRSNIAKSTHFDEHYKGLMASEKLESIINSWDGNNTHYSSNRNFNQKTNCTSTNNVGTCSSTNDIYSGPGYSVTACSSNGPNEDVKPFSCNYSSNLLRGPKGYETFSNSKTHLSEQIHLMNQSNQVVGKESLGTKSTKYKHRKIRSKPNRCYHLWDFLRDLLTESVYPEHKCVMWTDEKNGEFRITDTKMLATLWGDRKNSKSSKNMTYDKLSRTIRYYCTLDILKKIDGKRLQFRFSKGRMWSKTPTYPQNR